MEKQQRLKMNASKARIIQMDQESVVRCPNSSPINYMESGSNRPLEKIWIIVYCAHGTKPNGIIRAKKVWMMRLDFTGEFSLYLTACWQELEFFAVASTEATGMDYKKCFSSKNSSLKNLNVSKHLIAARTCNKAV